ncbi:MAG TPA: hypothetical protein VII03_01865 [Solirubrobacteraceae bacterium]
MISAIFVTLIILFALGFSLRSSRDGSSIARHPYNNRYNDASGAREDHVG